MSKADDRINDLFTQTRDFFQDKDFEIIMKCYTALKSKVKEDMYSELANECMTSVLSRRREGEEVSVETVTLDAINNLGLSEERNDAIVRLRELQGLDAIYDKTEIDRTEAIDEIMENLRCTKDLKNAVFLDFLNGENILVIAKKYRLTKKEVMDIYEERLGYVESILVVDHDILVKDVESREPFKSNVKMLTDSNK